MAGGAGLGKYTTVKLVCGGTLAILQRQRFLLEMGRVNGVFLL